MVALGGLRVVLFKGLCSDQQCDRIGNCQGKTCMKYINKFNCQVMFHQVGEFSLFY